MADPVTITCASACTVTLQVSLAPFDMTVEAAIDIAVAIAAVWAVAWVSRTLSGFISNGKSTNSED